MRSPTETVKGSKDVVVDVVHCGAVMSWAVVSSGGVGEEECAETVDAENDTNNNSSSNNRDCKGRLIIVVKNYERGEP